MTPAVRRLRLGSRGSALALWQARHVAELLRAAQDVAVEIQVIRTAGDRMQRKAPGQFSTKGIFVKEIEDALLEESIDLAVHSVKDLPGELPDGLVLGAFPPREDPRDVLITRSGGGLEALPRGGRVATSSLRRQAQLLKVRSDLRFMAMRGNVDTRLRKVERGGADGIVLAAAGLKRLGLLDGRAQVLPVEICLPAAGQAAIGVEARAADAGIVSLLAAIDHATTRAEVTAERAVLEQLAAGCLVPLAVLARHRGAELRVEGLVASPDGSQSLRESVAGGPENARELGRALAARLKEQGADELLALARQHAAPGLQAPDA